MLQSRFNFETECKHCGVKQNFWLWEHEVKNKYICGNCQFQEVILIKWIERIEVDRLAPK